MLCFCSLVRGQWVSVMHTVTVGIRLEISSLCSRRSVSLIMSGWDYKCPGAMHG